MVRVLACAVALVSLGSAVRAERIIITSASATYFTQRDTLEIVIRFSAPLALPGDYLGFAGWQEVGQSPPREMFALRSDGRVAGEIREPFYVGHTFYDDRGAITSRSAMGMPEIVDAGRTFTATMPLALTGLTDPIFSFSVYVYRAGEDVSGSSLEGVSAIDRRIIHTPEPSSLVLLGLAHLIWLPCLRQRFCEWRIREANRVGG